ncbi:MAG: hypothetical protein QXG08_07640 [Candidatus Methanomethyliaceae archaeon]
MYHGKYRLEFRGHAVFQHSTVKVGSFNEVRSLDGPQVTTIYGALAQCASMMGIGLDILDRVSITTPKATSKVRRDMLVFTAPLSPFDWQPKWINRNGEYKGNRRVFPRKVYALWRPAYDLHVFAEDREAVGFIKSVFALLANRSDGKVGADLRLGYKKKIFGSFDCWGEWDRQPLKERDLEGARVCETISDCPARFNAVVPLQPKVDFLTFRNVHRRRGEPPVVSCKVYAPGSVVLIKQDETEVRWFDYSGEVLGVSRLIEWRCFGGEKVKAVQGLFLTHEGVAS